MSDLISRQKVIKRIEELPNSPNGYSATYDKASIIRAIEDVEPAGFVHAHWIEEEDCTAYTDIPWSMCSACGSYSLKLPYCAFCGAKMDEAVKE